MVNRVVLIGRLTRDPNELRTSPSGVSVTSFTVAVDNRFSKQENNMNINETNDMNFWSKMKEGLSEVFTSTSLSANKEEELYEDINEQKTELIEAELEEQAAETTTETVVETTDEPTPAVEEPTVEEPKAAEITVIDEPEVDNHLEELVNSLRQEIETLKEMNNGLQDKVKELGKQPSAAPVNPQAKPSAADTYSAWREKMRQML